LHSKRILPAFVLFAAITCPALRAADRAKPKVGPSRASSPSMRSRIRRSLKRPRNFSTKLRETIQAAGYEVQGIRITTQPFPDYTRGLSRAEALKVLRGIQRIGGQATLRGQCRPCHVEGQ
jgi:hypothetical protein